MSLSDEFTARYSAVQVINLTNPDNTSATTADATRLAAAVADALGDFTTFAQMAYDGTNAQHVSAAVDRVAARLLSRRAGGAKQEMADSKQQLLDLAAVTSRSRILPRTSSVVVPTSEQTTDGSTPRPDFDRSRFGDFVPRAPGASDPWNR